MDCIGCLFTRQRLNKIGDFPYFAFGCNCLFFYPLEKPPFPVWINYIRQKAKRAVVSCNLTGVSPRPMLMGAPRNTLRVFNAGVSLCRLVCRRPQAAKPVLRRGSSRSAFPLWGKAVMAYPPTGSVQTECTRLPVMLRTKGRFLCQGTIGFVGL